jgi:TonB family protein
MLVTPDGRVDPRRIQVEQTNDPEFSAAAIRVAALMRFNPARVKGVPVPVWVVIPVTFQVMPARRSADADHAADFAGSGVHSVQPPKGSPSLCSNVQVCPANP